MRLRLGVALIGALVTVVSFQNCSGYNSDDSYAGSAGSSPVPCTMNCTPPPGGGNNTPDKFQAGAAFDVNLLPYVPQGNLLIELSGYAALTGFKAVAMAANGYGIVINHADIASQAEANRLALEACQVVAGDQPCAVLAEANTFKYSESVFKTSMAKVLETGVRSFDPAKAPWQRDVIRTTRLPGYLTYAIAFKAMALDLKGGGAIRGSAASQAEANRLALQNCEGFSRGRVCTIYAEANNVVFNVTTMNFNTTSSLDYTRTAFLASAVPFVNDAARTSLAAYTAYANANAGATLAIHPNGAWAYNASQAAALAACRTNAGGTSDCIVYANRLVVAFTKAKLDRAF